MEIRISACSFLPLYLCTKRTPARLKQDAGLNPLRGSVTQPEEYRPAFDKDTCHKITARWTVITHFIDRFLSNPLQPALVFFVLFSLLSFSVFQSSLKFLSPSCRVAVIHKLHSGFTIGTTLRLAFDPHYDMMRLSFSFEVVKVLFATHFRDHGPAGIRSLLLQHASIPLHLPEVPAWWDGVELAPPPLWTAGFTSGGLGRAQDVVTQLLRKRSWAVLRPPEQMCHSRSPESFDLSGCGTDLVVTWAWQEWSFFFF